jgi:hypothetical protein
LDDVKKPTDVALPFQMEDFPAHDVILAVKAGVPAQASAADDE